MKKGVLFIVAILIFSGGCEERQQGKAVKIKGPLLLSVDFKPGVALRYKFVSDRQIDLDFDPSHKSMQGQKDRGGSEQKMSERLEMDMIYKPVSVDPYGYSVIEATCSSAKVTRSSSSGRARNRSDAIESAAGRTFTLKITPTGKIVDYTSLEKMINELGEKAFGGSKSRIKDPDMIMDFVATQWYLWDSISSIKDPLKGVKEGQKWNSQLFAPMPFVSKVGRDVEYKYAGATEVNGVQLASITSSYSLSKSLPAAPMPYSGTFQMRGTFGFLRGYSVSSIEGSGQELYDIKRGVVKSDIQNYKATASSSIFGLGSGTIEPSIGISQTITMTLVE